MSPLEKLLPLLEPENLAKFASPKAVAAGTELFKNKCVSDLVVDGSSIRGRIKGTHPVPHSSSMKRTYRNSKDGLEAQCSCPTFSDGWEKICHHAVALAYALREQYQKGGELAMTENPWVSGLEGAASRRYTIEQRRGLWHVRSFQSGSARRGKATLSPADAMIQTFIDQAVDETDDDVPILEDAQLAGMLYFARDASVSIKGIGKISFITEPLVLRIQAESRQKDAKVELHAFLEHPDTERSFEVDEGRVIVGSPTWFLNPDTAELFTVAETPPWVLTSVAKQPRLVMDSRIDADQMDEISVKLQSAGVPSKDLHALASDSRAIDLITATIEGDAKKIKVSLMVRYGNVTVEITGKVPETARHTVTAGDQTISFYRDLDGEAAARKVLLDTKMRWSEVDGCFAAQGDDAIEFMIAGIPMMPEAWEKRVPKLPSIRNKSPHTSISVRNKGGSVLEVEAMVDVDGEEDLISFRDLLRWLHDGRRWVTLEDGSVAKLDAKILQPIADATGAMQFDKNGIAEISTLELGTLAQLLSEVPDAHVEKEVKKLLKNMTGGGARAPRKAKGLSAKLRPYQRSGFAWLWQLHQNQMTGILADDMGLGKTVQALALLAKAKEEEGAKPTLIVCPTSVLGVWRDEVKKWTKNLSVLIWHGTDRGENRRLLKKTDIVVTSYALLRRDIEELQKVRFRYVILDEAQYIKNWTTSTAKSAKKLKADHRLALSGTPVENHLVDLWAIFDFLAPGFLGKLAEFQRTYVRPIEDGDQIVLDGLRARVRPFVMRRKKEDVATDLPKKIEQTLYVQFGKKQLALYNRILKAARSEVQGRIDDVGLDKSHMTILAALTRLRQVATDPRLLGLPEGTTVPPSAKMEAFKQLMGEVIGGGHKALVFSQFVQMQKLIAAELDAMEIEYVWLHGGTKNRDELVSRFQRDDGPPVFLISLKAGGSGLTLTQADTVIHFDPWWNPAVEDQATDRAHRIGQEKVVSVYRLVIEHSVEQKMVELGHEKRKIAESAIGRDAVVGKKLTEQDIEDLLASPVAGAAAWDAV